MKLPMLYMIITDSKNISSDEQYLYLRKNQQTFITVYEIYNTINNIILGDSFNNIKNKNHTNDTPKSLLGQSLFHKINQKQRKSLNYKNMDYIICK